MNVILNGNNHPLPEDKTVTGLLIELGLADKPLVVEHNKVATFPRDYDSTVLKDNDSLEIITIAAGG
ncbi:MAG: sulfur carrier protein ThiS [Rubritalea sp.]|uniref:sulfur carrier protein ThiS n=1 Tax=Rubritalea sp. TaxID=2109375 RepID=UPI0032422BFC